MSNKTETQIRIVHKLSPGVYADLERKCGVPVAGTPEQTAFNLGVQHVLYLLRQGLVE